MANSNSSTATIMAAVVALVIGGLGGYMIGDRMAQPDAQVVATVNGEKITQTQLYKQLVKDGGQQVLDRMITARLVTQEAKKNNITITDADIQKELGRIKESVGGEEAYKQALMMNGITEEQLKESIVIQLSATKILSRDIKVDDAAVKAYFDENLEHFDSRQAKARHILVATEAEAKEIKKQLDGGADFAALAKEKSTEPGAKESGGDLGTFGLGRMVPEFDKAVFSMKKGEISQPVQTQFGWHVIQLLDMTGEAPDFNKLKDEVKSKMVDGQVQQMFGDWLANLKDKANIKSNLD